jgi:hypothetical protein
MNTQSRSGFKLVKAVLVLAGIMFFAGCNKNDEGTGNMELDFQFVVRGAPYDNYNVYVAWIENAEAGFIQNITVCKRLVNNSLTGIVLPFWKLNKYPLSKDEADAISSATIQDKSFKKYFSLKDSSIKKFTIYFELDRSNEYNDWFTDKRSQGAPNYIQDQPAILYKAEVDLNDTGVKTYPLQLYAWTPNDNTERIINGMKTGTPVLETRYITHKREGDGFGDWDNEHRIDRMVGSITLIIM